MAVSGGAFRCKREHRVDGAVSFLWRSFSVLARKKLAMKSWSPFEGCDGSSTLVLLLRFFSKKALSVASKDCTSDAERIARGIWIVTSLV